MIIAYAFGFSETSTEPVDVAVKVRNACCHTDPPRPYLGATASLRDTAHVTFLERDLNGHAQFVARVSGTVAEAQKVAELIEFRCIAL